jgi:uroporphyrinogen-III synthase
MVPAPEAGRLAPLAGYTVGVTADRRREEQVELLRRRGATVVEGPTVRTVPLVGDASLRAALEDLIDHPPDITVLTTGVGMRGLVAAAESVGREEILLDALAGSDVVARGPKAIGAAVAVGLDIAWKAPGERNHEVVEHLTPRARAGARIAVQRDGDEQPFVAMALAELGAEVVDVPVYRWVLPDDTAPAVRLLDATCAGAVDAITFTSSPAIRNLFLLAREQGMVDDLVAAFNQGTLAACVGPVCVATVKELGVADVAVPMRSRLGAMVQALVVAMTGRTVSLALAGIPVSVQGAVAIVGEAEVRLTDRERGVLHALIRARGAVVAKQRLLREVWPADAADEHAVEVTVARLRRRLVEAGAAVETVPRRGYRLVADPVPRPEPVLGA